MKQNKDKAISQIEKEINQIEKERHDFVVEHMEEYRKECHRLIDLTEDPEILVKVYIYHNCMLGL